MNTDIRLSTDFWTHPKTAKLTKLAGLKGVRSLQILWIWTARNRPDGILRGLDGEDVEFAADWRGKKGVFLAAVTELGWLETGEDGGYVIHDWQDHNSWAAESDERGDKARFSRLSRENPEVARHLREQGVTAISKDEYQTYKTAAPTNVPTTVPTNVERPYNDRSTIVPTPAPAPAPAPALRIEKECVERLPDGNPSTPEEPSDVPPGPEPASKPFGIDIPLVDGTDYAVTEADVAQWQDAYPGVNVPDKLRRIRAWADANPKKRKTRRGIRRCINGWLAGDQDKIDRGRASPTATPGDRPAYPQPMTPQQRYMRELGDALRNIEEAKHGDPNRQPDHNPGLDGTRALLAAPPGALDAPGRPAPHLRP